MAQTQTHVDVQAKNKVCIPSIQYPLRQLSRFETIMNIADLTHGLKDLPKDLAKWIEADVCSRDFSYYGFIRAPKCVESVKRIIGINGYYLKLTTQNTGVNFIWHDRERNQFQFWGDYNNCIKAMHEILYRIRKYVNTNTKTEDTVNASMMKKNDDSVQPRASIDEPIVFENDINPNPMVCYEAICDIDENGCFKVIADKTYPATS